MNSLPSKIQKWLLDAFQRPFIHVPQDLKEYFRKNSFFAKILMENPGTFEMLEKVYLDIKMPGIIDEYLFGTLSAKALKNRFLAVANWLQETMKQLVNHKGSIKVVNLGSGPGRDTVEALMKISYLKDRIHINCVDIDIRAVEVGKNLVEEKNLASSFTFINRSLMKLAFREELDLGLLIGVLCGLETDVCVFLLKRIKRYFKKGGLLIVSNVLETMEERDSFMAFILRRVIDWNLVYKIPDKLKKIILEAGYKWRGIFYDEPTRFHGIGIAEV